MGDRSAIQWTDATWNPVTGCSKVSPGCAHCYAERVAIRLWAKQYPPIPLVGTYVDDAGPASRPRTFTDVQCHEDRLDQPLRWTKPRKVFVNSMSDLFHEDVPDAFIADVWRTMFLSLRHTYQVLTKRAERMHAIMPRLVETFGVLPNVWLGVSGENRRFLFERMKALSRTPNAMPWVSLEPVLEDVSDELRTWLTARALRWVVCGGESGAGARPFDVAWARAIVQQCQAAGVPVFVKQLGANPYDMDGMTTCASSASDPLFCVRCKVRATSWPLHVGRVETSDRKGGDMAEWPDDLRVRETPCGR